jgi:hypothetical protein
MLVPVTVAIKIKVTDPKGKTQTINEKDTDVETWVKNGSSWQMKSMKSTK